MSEKSVSTINQQATSKPPVKQVARNPIKGIISGGIIGGLNVCIFYPTEFIKTHMQLYSEDAKQGIIYCCKKTYQERGLMGFYRGMSALIILSIPKTAVRFGSNEYFKKYIFQEKTRMNSFLAGLGAGVSEAILAVTPAETIKVKLIHDRLKPQSQYKGLVHGIASIVKQEGIMGIYRGCLPTVLKQGSNQGIRFLVYDEVLHICKHNLGLSSIPANFIGGAFAGLASVYANNPFDTVKTVLQGLDAKKYKGFADCFFQILKNEGIKGLYKGTVARLSRVVGDVAFQFTLYDIFCQLLDKVWQDKH